MAGGAILIARVRHVMGRGLHGNSSGAVLPSVAAEAASTVVAFQAHGEYDGPLQHPGVSGTMGHMAGLATIDSHRGVFKSERAALIGMAPQTRLFAASGGFQKPRARAHRRGLRESAVRIVAIGAIDGTFIDAMLERHGKLRAHAGVALVAELCLSLGQKKRRCGRTMDRMAIGANHISLGMCRAPHIGAGKILGMATKASVENLIRLEGFEGTDGGRSAAGRNVRIGWAVATFATGFVRRLIG